MNIILRKPGQPDVQRRIKIAVEENDTAKGLGYINLRDDEGMLFVFSDKRKRNFWMLNCISSLKIIFLHEWEKIKNAENVLKYPISDWKDCRAKRKGDTDWDAAVSSGQNDVKFVLELKHCRANDFIDTSTQVILTNPN